MARVSATTMTLDEDRSRGRGELYGADTVKAGEEALALDVG
jgi:hypothetical protein